MNTFFKVIKLNTFVLQHAKIMMYTCSEDFGIEKYNHDPLIVATVITRQHGLMLVCRHDGIYIWNITQSLSMPTCCHQYFLKNSPL